MRSCGNRCITHRPHKPSVGGQLLAAGGSFTAYADGLPHAGAATCAAGDAWLRAHLSGYARWAARARR